MQPAPALTQALANVQPGTRIPGTARGMIRYVGGTAVMAQLLAGTTDKKSTAYKSQLRNVQRWLSGSRKPSPASLTRLQAAAWQVGSARATGNLRTRGAVSSFSGTVGVSQDTRFRDITDVFIPPEAMSAVLDLWEDGQRTAAAEAFFDAMFESYGLFGATVLDVEQFTLSG